MLDGGPEASNPNFSMTAFAFAGVEAEIQPFPAGVTPGPPEKFPAVHQPIILHMAKLGVGLADESAISTRRVKRRYNIRTADIARYWRRFQTGLTMPGTL